MSNRTGRIAVFGSLVTAGALCLGVAVAQAQSLTVSSVADAAPGSQVAISVTLGSGTAQVAGTQSTLTFDNTNATLNLKSNGKADCTVNADIDKAATTFGLQPAGCSGSTCTGVKALVLSFDNSTAIPDGSVLFTCKVNIAATASGTSTVAISGVGASDPDGKAIAGVTGVPGTITIAGGGPSPTPTTGQPTPRPTPSGPALIVGIVDASAGQQLVPLSVTLFSGGAQVAGTQSTLTFDNTNVTLNLKSNGKADCAVNADIDKGATTFGLQPAGCSGSACTGVKALVLSFDNSTAIPDGSVLFTCNVNVAATATTSTVTISGAGMSDPDGKAVAGVTGQNGAVVLAGPPPTTPPTGATNTPTNTPVPPTNTPTNTVVPPTNTPTFTPTPIPATNTPQAPAPQEDEGGCQIGTASNGMPGWLLLIPVAGLVAIRRRQRR